MMADPTIFRAYDIRGTYPNQMNERIAYAAGQAFVQVMGARRVIVGRDVRTTGPSLQQAAIQGVTDAGADVIDVGVISTEMLYYGSTAIDCDGGMSLTASHNPGDWNGIKFIGKNGVALAREEKLGEIYTFMQEGHKVEQYSKGNVTTQDLLDGYAAFLKPFIPAVLPQLKIVANVNFGANGKVVDKTVAGLPLEIVRLNWEEDGTFPKGKPDPLLPKNREEISALVLSESGHFGVAWDADADRCFFYDEKGRFFHGYYITAMLIKKMLAGHPGEKVLIEPRLVWATQAAAAEAGGEAILKRAGHTYIKRYMREYNAIFAGEISGHYFFRDFSFCDSGMIAFLTIMGIFAEQISSGSTVSALLDQYLSDYPIMQEEMNFTTSEGVEIIKTAEQRYADGEIDKTDGVTVSYPTWRFNLRSSNTEPVLRLNIEAKSNEELSTRIAELRSFITDFGATVRDDA